MSSIEGSISCTKRFAGLLTRSFLLSDYLITAPFCPAGCFTMCSPEAWINVLNGLLPFLSDSLFLSSLFWSNYYCYSSLNSIIWSLIEPASEWRQCWSLSLWMIELRCESIEKSSRNCFWPLSAETWFTMKVSEFSSSRSEIVSIPRAGYFFKLKLFMAPRWVRDSVPIFWSWR